ncbi:hypothetical protein Fmac_013710 [Flemingia macrophylla]|uniref:Uncharacterized protein n=1 Tax=Flemingia macrophylla TaxID=520843 RepID=A0ABD1MTZ4_9FABA
MPPPVIINEMPLEQLSSFVQHKYWVRQYILNSFPEDIKTHIINLAQKSNWEKVMVMIDKIQNIDMDILPYSVVQYSEHYDAYQGILHDVFPPQLCVKNTQVIDEELFMDSYFCGLLHMFKMTRGTQPPPFLGPKVCNIIQKFIAQKKICILDMVELSPIFLVLRVYVYSSYPFVDNNGEHQPSKHHFILSYELDFQSSRFRTMSPLMLATTNYTQLTSSPVFDKTGLNLFYAFLFDLNYHLQLLGETQLCKIWCPLKRASTLWHDPLLHPDVYRKISELPPKVQTAISLICEEDPKGEIGSSIHQPIQIDVPESSNQQRFGDIPTLLDDFEEEVLEEEMWDYLYKTPDDISETADQQRMSE